ncbi:MAG: hypothetical protein P9L99_07830 [Candidatus Lernaella stagnicola]|nr:hypothetical protein [Candidatus Lernaella stagnicola]
MRNFRTISFLAFIFLLVTCFVAACGDDDDDDDNNAAHCEVLFAPEEWNAGAYALQTNSHQDVRAMLLLQTLEGGSRTLYTGGLFDGDWVLEPWLTLSRDNSQFFSVVDDAGYLHVSYRKGNYPACDQYYGTTDPAGPSSQVVENTDYIGWQSPIALDPSGRPVIVYGLGENQPIPLYVARLQSGEWTREAVEIGGEAVLADKNTQLAIDGLGALHILLGGFGDFTYLTDASGEWTSQAVPLPETNWLQTMAMTAAGDIYALFLDNWDDEQFYVVTNESGEWESTSVSGLRHYLAGGDMALDAEGNVHVVFAAESEDHEDGVFHVTNASGGWETQEIALREANPEEYSSGVVHMSDARIAVAGGTVYLLFEARDKFYAADFNVENPEEIRCDD